MEALKKCAAVISKISAQFARISIIMMWCLVALILSEIIARNLFQTSLGLSLQLSMWLFVALIFLGSAYTLDQGGHVRVVIVFVLLPEKIQSWMIVVSSAIGSLIAFWLFWFGLHEAVSCYKINKIGACFVYMPYWPVWIVFSAGLLMVGLQFTSLMIQEIVKLVGGEVKSKVF